MGQPVCLITGVGDGTGAALARRFAKGGYRVAMLARERERLEALEEELPGTRAFAGDLGDLDHLHRVCGAVGEEMGAPEIILHNAVRATFESFLDADPAELERNFRVNTTALLYLARAFTPGSTADGARSSPPATRRPAAGSPNTPSSRPRRRLNAFWRRPWRGTSGRRESTSPTSS